MTTDPFTEAARAEAKRVHFPTPAHKTPNVMARASAAAFCDGASWARDHLATEVRKGRAAALRDAADSVHDNAASPYCLPCHRDDADLLRTIATTIEEEDTP